MLMHEGLQVSVQVWVDGISSDVKWLCRARCAALGLFLWGKLKSLIRGSTKSTF
jgi:hypothetical protein